MRLTSQKKINAPKNECIARGKQILKQGLTEYTFADSDNKSKLHKLISWASQIEWLVDLDYFHITRNTDIFKTAQTNNSDEVYHLIGWLYFARGDSTNE